MKLAAVRAFALWLPEATEEAHFELTSFRIRGKVFATAPADGDYVNIFVDEELRAPLIAPPLGRQSGWCAGSTAGRQRDCKNLAAGKLEAQGARKAGEGAGAGLVPTRHLLKS